MLILKKVTSKNSELAKTLQATIFPKEKSPTQVDIGIRTNNPANFIAYAEKNAIGIVGYYTEPELPEHLIINWFGVLPQFRNKGYGSKILSWLISHSKRRKEYYLTTYTEKGVNDDAIKLYKKFGFTIADYCNKKDIENLHKRGVENNYVICFTTLKRRDKKPNLEEINLHISEDLDAIKNASMAVSK